MILRTSVLSRTWINPPWSPDMVVVVADGEVVMTMADISTVGAFLIICYNFLKLISAINFKS